VTINTENEMRKLCNAVHKMIVYNGDWPIFDKIDVFIRR
jgi:hypothetical protein